MSNCFENVPHEALDFCPNDENAAGIATRLLYIPTEFLEKLDIPTPTGDFATRVTIPEANLVIKSTKSFKGIDVLVDENELKNMLVGNKGNTKAKSELECFVPGMRPEVVGFIDTYKNVPMVCAIPDANGTIWLLGTKMNPAFFESADGTTGKKYEDNAGVTVKISANSRLHKYGGAITETAAA